LGIGLLGLENLDPVALQGQLMGQQAAHQASAQHHAPRLMAHADTALS
jgi:hypothetical protein